MRFFISDLLSQIYFQYHLGTMVQNLMKSKTNALNDDSSQRWISNWSFDLS